jgi:subtilisin family serine protease
MHRKTIIALLLLVWLMPMSADAARLGPLLQQLQERVDKEIDGGLHLESLISLEPGADKSDPRVGVILRLEAELPSLDHVPGLIVGSISGRVVTARLPVSSLDELETTEGLLRIRAARLLQPSLDQAVDAAQVRSVWNGSPAFTGQGVLVGIIDSGIDWTHDDFKTTAGQTRIKAIWDQYGIGTPPTGFFYGAEFSESQINSGTLTEEDISGHGTHVAGIAAGNGRASSGSYRGVAFNADLLIAKPYDDTQGGFPENKTIDAMNYMAQKAQTLGRPIVVNMSLGGHQGPHDGTSDQAAALDDLSAPGVVFCVAAGNEGEEGIHDETSASAGGFGLDLREYESTAEPVNDYVVMEIWIDGDSSPELNFRVGTKTYGPFSDGTKSSRDTADGFIYVVYAPDGPDPVNGDKMIYVQMDGQRGTPLTAATWSVNFSGGSGRAHGWIVANTVNALFSSPDPGYTVAVPGTAAEAITVAAVKTRNEWETDGGTVYYQSDWGALALGEIAPFSSHGPTRDGREKPDIAAPGMAVISCLGKDAVLEQHEFLIVPGNRYWASQGTSMACPLVAGTVAMMMEKDPLLTADAAKSALSASAVVDDQTGAVWNNVFGHGKLNAMGAVALISGEPIEPDGDLNGDGSVTTADVLLVADYIRDPVGNPLNYVSSRHADVYPDGAPDGVINIYDLTRVIAFRNGEDPQPPFTDYAAAAALVLDGPVYENGAWWIDATFSGAGLGGCQFALDVDGAQWQTGDGQVDPSGSVELQLAQVNGELRVLLYDMDNTLPSGGVTLRLPFQHAADSQVAMTAQDLLMADVDGQVRLTETTNNLAFQLNLLSVGPNPAPTETRIRISLNRPRTYTLGIFDLRGRRVREFSGGDDTTQEFTIDWNGHDQDGRLLPAGIYLLRLQAGDLEMKTKMMFIR